MDAVLIGGGWSGPKYFAILLGGGGIWIITVVGVIPLVTLILQFIDETMNSVLVHVVIMMFGNIL